MATRIDVLSVGYALNGTVDRKYMEASGSCCLVRSGRISVIFDTMGPWESAELVDKLSTIGVHADDVNYVVCSHSHPDHAGNLNLFTRAEKHFVGTSVYTKDVYDLNCFECVGSYVHKSSKLNTETEVEKHAPYRLDHHLTIERTPGHTAECISMIVRDCDIYGTVGLAGDLFENEEDIKEESVWLAAGSQQPDLQRAHRTRIFNQVDYILPGHGPMFRSAGEKNF